MNNFFEKQSAIAAIVTTYEPKIETLKDQFRRLQGQVELLLVVDNGSSNSSDVAEIVSKYPFAQFIGAPENQGLGWAHNEGIRRVLAMGAGAVLLLDQDSLPRDDMVANLDQALND